MSDYQIVKAEIKDWPDLVNIFDKSLRWSTTQYSEDDYKSFYKNLMSFSYPTFDTYIFKKNDKSVAYVSYWNEKKLIKMLYVLPEYTNQGIGNKLLQHILKTYRETMTISVSPTNDIAMHLYTKYGFEISSKEEYDTSGVYSPHYVLTREYKKD